MSALKVTGGIELSGSVRVKGSKNAALAILSGVLVSDQPVTLRNLPNVRDVQIMLALLRDLGAEVSENEDAVTIDCCKLSMLGMDAARVRMIRTSFYVLGPLLARLGSAQLPQPGGCRIGARPVDFHIKGLRNLGATINYNSGVYDAHADSLRGAEIYLDFPSAGATQHLMSSAVLAVGQTIIRNAATEPEVVALADFLNRLGGRVEGAGTSTVTITGVDSLKSADYTIPPDRIQAGTYLIAGAASKGDVTVCDILPEHQGPLMSKLKESGIGVEEGPDWVRVIGNQYMEAVTVKTMPHPGFSTDIQQPMAALLTLAHGVSTIEETIYESRIGHIDELSRMGAKIRLEGRTCVVTGVDHLQGTAVEASDLRAGAALVVAGLAARGETIIGDVHHIDRGYEDLEESLRSLGAKIERIPSGDLETAKEWSD